MVPGPPTGRLLEVRSLGNPRCSYLGEVVEGVEADSTKSEAVVPKVDGLEAGEHACKGTKPKEVVHVGDFNSDSTLKYSLSTSPSI